MIKHATSLAVVAAFSLLAALAAEDMPVDSLNRTLASVGPILIAKAKEKGYRNIGVLKFQVKKGTSPLTDNAGTLNLDLARRLELALILAKNNNVADPVGVIKNASAVAAKLKDA